MLVMLLVLSFVGCGKESEEAQRITNDDTKEEAVAAEPTEEVAEEPAEEPADMSKIVTGVCDPWPPFVDPGRML